MNDFFHVKSPLETDLSDALYAMNRAIWKVQDIMDGSEWSELERSDYDKLVSCRDHIWSMLQTISPADWKD